MTEPFERHWVQRTGRSVEQVARFASFEQTLAALAADPELVPVAGGTDLTVDLARSQGAPVRLLDLSRVEGFRTITSSDDEIVLGGGVTHNDVVSSDIVVREALPVAQACLEIGSPQLRNRATVAGNLVTASPANDSISALMAVGATVDLARFLGGHVERRTVEVAAFFAGFRETVIEPGELIEAIRLPRSANAAGVWVKSGLRRAQAISVVHAGLWVAREADGLDAPVAAARIALGSVAPTVVLAEAAMAALAGRTLTSEVIAEAARAAAGEVAPIDDGRATAEYRRSQVELVVRRGLGALAAGREGERWPARVPTLRTTAPDVAAAPERTIDDEAEISVEINGTVRRGRRAASSTLLEWIREHAGTGTKEGCAEGECGACTVLLDGEATMSCLSPAAQADGANVVTVEGLARGDVPNVVQQRFVDHFAVQCGFCIPGFVVAASALVDEFDNVTREEIEFAMAGNLCRCTGYYPIIEAIAASIESSP